MQNNKAITLFQSIKEVRGSWDLFKCLRQLKRTQIFADGRMVAFGLLGLRSAVLTELCWLALKWPGYLEAEVCFSFYTNPLWASSAMYIDLGHPWRLPVRVISVWRNNHESAPQRKTWFRISRWRFQLFGLFLRFRHTAWRKFSQLCWQEAADLRSDNANNGSLNFQIINLQDFFRPLSFRTKQAGSWYQHAVCAYVFVQLEQVKLSRYTVYCERYTVEGPLKMILLISSNRP
jgi:hypothetical protein